jgi:hypothetical protein
LKQDGKCRSCGKEFAKDEQIVSNGKNKKYYHTECAQKLNIIISLRDDLANEKSN